MSKQGKSRKSLVIGIIAAVVVLAGVLALLLTQCTFGNTGETTAPSTTEGEKVIGTYDLYWNVDRALYDGMSEAGMSSRTPEDDGYFHVRFFKDGEIVTLKVAERKTINAMEVKDLMGLEFDENGIVIGIIPLEELPCEMVAWQFYVQSAGGKVIKANSSASLNGMEVMIETNENTGIWDMTGLSGDVGCVAEPIPFDRILGIANEAGEVTHVFIYSRENYMRTHEAECEHCGKVVEWSEWTKTTAAPSITGHYQLMNDIAMTTGQIAMAEDTKICLDLNGKRIDGKANARVYALFNPGTELAIMDTSEAKTGTIAAHGKGDQGMCVWLRYGVVYLYDGILDGSDATSIKNGCTVAMQGNTYMYMHGGEIIGGTSTYLKQDNGKYTNGLGGTLAIANKAKFVLNDGVIRDGYAQAIVTKRDAKGQPTTYERGIGGNIFMSTGSVFEMNGGVIKNGKAGNYAGNIMLDGTAEFTMNGGKIQGGTITAKGKNGGSIYIASKATFTLKSGTITGGSARNCAGNIYTNGKFIMTGGYVGGGKIINWTTGKVTPNSASRNVFVVNGTFRMYGGSIDGGVQAIDTDAKKTVTSVGLTTYATIASETAPNLTISSGGSGVVVNVGTLRDKAKIGVSTNVGLFSEVTSQDNLDNFYSDIEGAEVVYYQERLGLGKLNCLCGEETHMPGCDGEQLFWAPWTATDKLPTTTGNYYLLKDVTCGQQNVAADAVVNLDLNGHVVNGKDNTRIYSMHYRVENEAEDGTMTYEYPAHLTITDTSENHDGKMISHGTNAHQGSIAWLRYGDVTILAGIFDASDYKLHGTWNAGADGLFGTADDKSSAMAGAAISVPYGRTFTMYGGTVIGGETIAFEHTKTNTIPAPEDAPEGTEPTTEEVKKTVNASHGGTFDVSGTVYMYGGTIRDGVSGSTAGNIRVNSGGKFYMYGGTISGGTSSGNGGNVQVSGTFYLEGGKIVDGWSKNTAGNFHVAPGKLVMSGGYIGGGKTGSTGSTTAEHANVFCVNGKMDISGGEIAGHVRIICYNTQGTEGGSVVNFSGDPVISGNKVNVVLAPQDDKTGEKDDGKTPAMPILNIVGPMAEGAKVEISTATLGIDFAVGEGYTVTEKDAKAFSYSGLGLTAAADTENNSLFFGRFGCLCGKETHTFGCQQAGEGKALKWYAWTKTDSLPTTGNYFLAQDVTGSGSTTVKPGTTLNLDLNGKTVTWRYRAYRIYDADVVSGATLTLTNTAEANGTIRAVEHTGADQGCAVWVASGENGTFNLLDGVVLDGSKYTVKNVPSEETKKDDAGNKILTGKGATAEKNGGVVAINGGGIFNMYGGTIIGANAIRSEEITLSNGTKYSSWAPNGAAVAVTSGNANMYGGTITGGRTANQGGNLLISGGKFNMLGGTISDGHAASNAGNVFVHRSGELHMSGDARIENGTSEKHSGNLNVDGILTMTGSSVVTGGKAGTGAGNINVNFISSGGKTYYGTLTISGKASVTDGEAGTSGGNIRGLEGTTVTISDDAVISGGIATTGNGGNIAVDGKNAKLTVSGNVSVTGGKAPKSSGGNIAVIGENAKLDVSGNTQITDGEAMWNGGNIQVVSGADMTASGDVIISGGTVWGNGNNTEPSGGNLMTNNGGSTITLTGNVQVKDGKSYHTAGNIRVSNSATLIIRDNVQISGGLMTNSKGDTSKKLAQTVSSSNIFVVNGNMELYGGNITGNVNIYCSKANGASLKIAGDPVVSKGGSGCGIAIGGTVYIPFKVTGAMTGEAGSVVIGNGKVGVVGSGSDYQLTDTDAAVFVSDQQGEAVGGYIVRRDNDLVVAKASCLCGKEQHTKACLDLWNGEARSWIAWTSKTSLPTTTGNYYLTGNVDFDTQQKIAQDANVVLDLNGKTVTNDNGQRMYANWNTGVSLTITDKTEKQEGKFIASGNASDQGAIWVRYGTFNLVAGTIDASGYTLSNHWDSDKQTIGQRDGGAVDVDSGCTFNMYGGTIIGAKGVQKTIQVNGADKDLGKPNGGAVAVAGTFNMYSGTITGGHADGFAGNVHIAYSGKMHMSGNARVEKGTSGSHSGNINVDGILTMTDNAVVTGGNAKTGAGNINANFVTSGGKTYYGNVTIGGKASVTDGEAGTEGGNLRVLKGATITIKDEALISGGTSGSNAGSIMVSGNLIMDGGKVTGGTSTKNGGNIRIDGTGTLTLNSGTIENGWGKNVTGNIHVDGGELVMNGGTITGGKSTSEGVTTKTSRNINSVNGKVELNGGTVDDGVEINYYSGSVAPTTKISGNAVVNGVVRLNYTDGLAQPLLNVDSSFTGSLKVYVKSDGIITTGPVTAAQAAKITTTNSGKDVYRLTDKMTTVAEDVGKLYVGQVHCVCGASITGSNHYTDICDGTIHYWTPTDKLIDSDGKGANQYYYFTTNVTSATTQLWGDEHNVTYDLNGYKLTVNAGRAFHTFNASGNCSKPLTLTLTDTVGSASIVVNDNGDEGRIVWLRGSKKTLNMYNLDINISNAAVTTTHTVSKDGVAIHAGGWSNNVSLYKVNVTGGTSMSNGNFMGVAGEGNKALMKDCTISGCNTNLPDLAYGGNGGAIWVNTKAQLTLDNTQITGCVAENNGGGVYVAGTGKLILTGNTKITGNTVNGVENNVYLEESATIETGSLGSNAQVGLSGVTGDILSTDVTYAEMDKYFKADSNSQQLAHMGDGLSLQDAASHIHCVCAGTQIGKNGHTCKDIVYTAVTGLGSVRDITGNNNWYLSGDKTDVTLDGQRWIKGTMNLCLNGHNLIGGNGSRVLGAYEANAKLTITTCDEAYVEGSQTANTIKARSSASGGAANGAVVWVTKGVAELYRGTLDASQYTLKAEVTDKVDASTGVATTTIAGRHGAAVNVQSGGKFYMYDGTIIGGKTISIAGNYKNGTKAAYREASHGGAVAIYAGTNFYMYDGVIRDGTCGWGVSVNGERKNEGWGGNIYLMGTMHMYGGEIRNGAQAKQDGTRNTGWTGSNVTIRENGVLNMYGGTITGTVRGMTPVSGTAPTVNVSGSAKIFAGENANNIYVGSLSLKVGSITEEAKIGLLILSESSINASAATVADGVEINPAQFPVYDLELPNSSTRSFAVQQDGTSLKIIETTN